MSERVDLLLEIVDEYLTNPPEDYAEAYDDIAKIFRTIGGLTREELSELRPALFQRMKDNPGAFNRPEMLPTEYLPGEEPPPPPSIPVGWRRDIEHVRDLKDLADEKLDRIKERRAKKSSKKTSSKTVSTSARKARRSIRMAQGKPGK